MKVIIAGMPKTGTKTMHEALKILGYSIYDYPENYWYLHDQWMKICNEGGTTEDFRKMYEGVDACMDIPCCHYWEEIHNAFPESKIIFTTRKDEDDWFRSFSNQMEENTTWLMTFLMYFSPVCRKMLNYTQKMTDQKGLNFKWNLLKKATFNELATRMWYRRHNAYVLAKAPKDKMLEYNVREGWEPLCKFLGVAIPDVPFPHKNKGGGILKEYMETHPLFIRIGREALASAAILVAAVAYVSYDSVTSNSFEDSVLGFPGRLLRRLALHCCYQAL